MWRGSVSSASAHPLAQGHPVKSPILEQSGSAPLLGCHNPSLRHQSAAGYPVQDAAGIAVTLQSFENRVRSLEGELAKAQQKVAELTSVLQNRSPSPSRGEADGISTPRSVSNCGRRTPGRRLRDPAWNPGGNPNPREGSHRSPRKGSSSPNTRIIQKKLAARAGASSCDQFDAAEPWHSMSPLWPNSQGLRIPEEGIPPMSPSRGQSVSSTTSLRSDRMRHESPDFSTQRSETPTYNVKGRYNLSPREPRRLRSASPRELRHHETNRRQGKMPTPTPPPRVTRRFNAAGAARKPTSMKDMRQRDFARSEMRGDYAGPTRSQSCAQFDRDGMLLPPDYMPFDTASCSTGWDDLADDELRKIPLEKIVKKSSHPFIDYLYERGWAHRAPPGSAPSTISSDCKEDPTLTANVDKEATEQNASNTGSTVTPTSSSMPVGCGSLSSAVPLSPQQLSSAQSMPNMQVPLKVSCASSESGPCVNSSQASLQSTAAPPSSQALRSPGSQDWLRQSSSCGSGDSTPTQPPSVCATARPTTGQVQAPVLPPSISAPPAVVTGRAPPIRPSAVPPTVVHCAGFVNGRISRSSLGSVSGVSTVSSLSSPAPTRMMRAASAAYVRPATATATQVRPVQTGSCRLPPGHAAQARILPGKLPAMC